MSNNASLTEEVANGAKTILKKFKFLLKIVICIALLLILLVSFLKEIWKADTADQMMDKKYVEDKEKEND